MAEIKAPPFAFPSELVDVIKSMPHRREVQHCGIRFETSPFDIYAVCPSCGHRIKVRAFSGIAEIEDLFDAFLSWMLQNDGEELARRRLQELRDESED